MDEWHTHEFADLPLAEVVTWLLVTDTPDDVGEDDPTVAAEPPVED